MTTAEDIYYDLLPVEAMDQLQALARKGDHEAELYLGHLMDESSPRDPFGALFWYKKAAEGGLLEAKHWVASFTFHGMGTNQDVAAAVRLLHECAEAGLDAAQWKLGQHLLQFSESRIEALHWLRGAARQRHTAAIELLAAIGESAD